MTPNDKLSATEDGGDAASAGLPSYGGYEYQILATVWLGLELTLSGRAAAIIVEPPSAEDVAAQLDVPAEAAASHIEVGKFLQIQIKLRNKFLWNRRAFGALLAGRIKKGTPGPAPRERPVEYLKTTPSCHYILLTNAPVDSGLQNFVI
ncbi:MAG: hypothetical protein ABW168_06325, partial [Sedimenticola sp.]